LVKFPNCEQPSNAHLCRIVDIESEYRHLLDVFKPNISRLNAQETDYLICQCASAIYDKLVECANDNKKNANLSPSENFKWDLPSWTPPDGLPLGYPFDYEKDIIEEFVKGNGRLLDDTRLQQGCPLEWPQVKRIIPKTDCNFVDNPVLTHITGKHRPSTDQVIVDARSQYHTCTNDRESRCLIRLSQSLSFLEAGPRKKICYPLKRYPQSDDLNIGIVVSGGIAPGINAVIAGICSRHVTYHKNQKIKDTDDQNIKNADDQNIKDEEYRKYVLTIKMYRDGFLGMLHNFKIELTPEEAIKHISTIVNQGGSWISTARHDELLDTSNLLDRQQKIDGIIDRLKDDHIDILYVIGGEGTMRAAHTLFARVQQRLSSKRAGEKLLKPISIVGIPKTMDNDILWVWQAFGFLSAVEKAKEFISQLDTEAKSNPRLCIAQLFGSDSGFVVSHAAFASGVCKAALIPEVEFAMRRLSAYVRKTLELDYDNKHSRLGQSPNGIILLAETAIPKDIEKYIDSPDYPELQLTEEEKEAIRRFVGSPLLNISDIKKDAWPRLLTTLAHSMSKPSNHPLRLIFEKLNNPIRTLFRNDEIGDVFKDEISYEIKSLVVKALNQLIQQGDFLNCQDIKSFSLLCDLGESLKDIESAQKLSDEEHIDILNKRKPKSLNRNPILTLQLLQSYPLSYVAKTAVDSLLIRISDKHLERVNNDSSGEEKKLWIDQFNLYIQEIYSEVVRTYNRLFLEEVFTGELCKLTLSNDRRVHGQTPDALRSGGLKVVSTVLQHDIRQKMTAHKEYWKRFRVFTNEPRHLLRAIPPSVSDVVFGQRLGILAVDNAIAGYTDFMVSQWLTEYVLVPLELVVLGRKRVPQEGIFWKGVLQSTGQPPKMAD